MVALSGGSTSTYYHDSTYQNAAISRVVYRSYNSAYSNGGVSYASAFGDSSDTCPDIGSRLAFRGKIVEARSVAAYKAIVEIS